MLRKISGVEEVIGVIKTICLDSGEFLGQRPPDSPITTPFVIPSPPVIAPPGSNTPPPPSGGYDVPNYPPIEVFVYNYDTGVFERRTVSWGGALFGGYGKPAPGTTVPVPPNFG